MDVFGSAWTRWTEVKMLFDNVNILCSCVIGQVVTYIVLIKFTLNTKSVVLNLFYGMTLISGNEVKDRAFMRRIDYSIRLLCPYR